MQRQEQDAKYKLASQCQLPLLSQLTFWMGNNGCDQIMFDVQTHLCYKLYNKLAESLNYTEKLGHWFHKEIS